MPLNKALFIIYCWSQKYSISQTVYEVQVSEKVVISYFESLRDAAYDWSELHHTKIGGYGKTVEIDETQFSKRKNQQGRILPGSDIWVFGGICRETKKVFAIRVDDRTSRTLIPLINTIILPGTKIISDGWSAYTPLRNGPLPARYTHQIVNHSQNFVDPITGAHTQGVERMWRDLKEVKKRYNGVRREEIDTHIGEFLWRKNNRVEKHNAFRKTLELLAETIYKSN